jgi:hypothetical protein
MQVCLMADIYSCASRTLVWLGEETPDVAQSFEAIRIARGLFPPQEGLDICSADFDRIEFETSQFDKDKAGEISLCGVDWQIVVNLLARPWFRRKWIIQEVAKATQIVIICGLQQMAWGTLSDLIIWLSFHSLTFARYILFHPLANASMTNVAALLMFSDSSDMPSLLPMTMGFTCSDHRDNIISLLGLASDVSDEDMAHLADYSLSPVDFFRRYAMWLLRKHQSIEFLDFGFDPIARQAIVIPSWLLYIGVSHEGLTNPLTPFGVNYLFDAAKGSQPQASFLADGERLTILGKPLDEIKNLSSARTIEQKDMNNTVESARTVLQKGSLWFREAECIACQDCSSLTSERFEDFWRTICLDRETDATRASSDFGTKFSEFLQVIHGKWVAGEDEDIQQDSANLLMRLAWVQSGLMGRRFCVTSGERYGLVDAAAQVGDRICMFYGGRMPYIIRPTGDGEYSFVGIAYLHGVMDGEAVGREDIPEEEFTLI